MRDTIEARLTELRRELEAGKQMLAELESRRAEVQTTVLRISGAIQVLEELIASQAGE